MRLLLAAMLLTAALAGCVVEEDPGGDGPAPTGGSTSTPTTSPPGGGQGFAPQQGTAHGEHAGIEVHVRWEACEAGFCANATATNNGTATVQVSSICQSPWTDRMARDGQPVRHREDQAMCLAYGRAPFAPGDTRHADLSWDATVHPDGDAKGEPAPEGAYTWSIVFWWEDAAGTRSEAAADIHLIIGET